MSDLEFDPHRFFEAFPRFVETSETGHTLDRLNARYVALIHSNRELLEGRSVLDLGSHDGRWSFAALKNGASRVTGIDHKPRLLRKSRENMEFYQVPSSSYEFVVGDMFERLDEVEHFDVVFLFGIFYHINDHMLFLSKIAQFEPLVLIIDTRISRLERPAIELIHEKPHGKKLVGLPTKAGVDVMFASFGWTPEYFDWHGSGLLQIAETGPADRERERPETPGQRRRWLTRTVRGKPSTQLHSGQLQDYSAGRRVTAVVRCQQPQR